MAPDRDGSTTKLKKLYTQFYGIPNRSYSGHGDRTVTLIDNVRDSNFYRPQDPDGKTYIGGFFYSVFNEMTNRNVMTIDSFDWKHRTGTFDSQPDDATNPEYVACGNEIGRAFGNKRGPDYEGTFAHEYQHLLEYYEDPAEVNWVNEGLSDWAQTLTGYVDPQTDPADPTADGHLASFLGFGGEAFGGPEQSMTRWEDQGPTEILADYGAAYSFMQYLWSHFGQDAFMSALHTENAGGLVGPAERAGRPRHEPAEGARRHPRLAGVDGAGRRDRGRQRADQQRGRPVHRLDAGEDQLGLAAGLRLARCADQRRRLRPARRRPGDLHRSRRLRPGPGGVDHGRQPPLLREGRQPGPGHRAHGQRPERQPDRVGGPPVRHRADLGLRLRAGVRRHREEVGEPGVAGQHHVRRRPEARPAGRRPTCPVSPGPGGPAIYTYTVPAHTPATTILLAVRYITDSSVDGEGVWLSSLAVGGTNVPDATTLSSWTSLTQAVPVPVESWTVQVVGYNATQSGRAFVTLTTQPDGSSTGSIDPATALGFTPTTLGAIVTVNDSSETVADYGRYELAVDGTVQPGG